MFNKKFITIIYLLTVITLIFTLNCKKENEFGILGIQVPVGEGKVTGKTPYRITGVYNPGPAYEQGVRPDDIILQVNNTEIKNGMNYDYIFNNLLRAKAGEKITLLIKRGKKKLIFQIIYAKR